MTAILGLAKFPTAKSMCLCEGRGYIKMQTFYLHSIETFSYAMAKNTKIEFVDLDILY